MIGPWNGRENEVLGMATLRYERLDGGCVELRCNFGLELFRGWFVQGCHGNRASRPRIDCSLQPRLDGGTRSTASDISANQTQSWDVVDHAKLRIRTDP